MIGMAGARFEPRVAPDLSPEYAFSASAKFKLGQTMSVNVQGVIWGLEELANKAEQERLWLSDGKDGREVSSFDEAFCCTFDDTGLSSLLDKGEVSERIPPAQIESLKHLSVLLKSIPSHLGPRDEIDHPVMIEIRKLAAEIMANLRAH